MTMTQRILFCLEAEFELSDEDFLALTGHLTPKVMVDSDTVGAVVTDRAYFEILRLTYGQGTLRAYEVEVEKV
jgi:hypothetical protein